MEKGPKAPPPNQTPEEAKLANLYQALINGGCNKEMFLQTVEALLGEKPTADKTIGNLR